MKKGEVVIAIPARFGSTRLKGKALLDIAGKPMIVRVAERTKKLKTPHQLLVATDDQRIVDALNAIHVRTLMTSPQCASGTDRIAEAIKSLSGQIVVNLQGDEPLFPLQAVDEAIALLSDDADLDLVTIKAPFLPESRGVQEWRDPNVVKVMVDENEQALFFSRLPIPFSFGNLSPEDLIRLPVFRHVGIYVYRRECLIEFAAKSPTQWEQSERLEQLRALELGWKIGTVTASVSPRGVDTAEDLVKINKLFKDREDII